MNINRVRGFGKIRGKNEKKMIWFLVVELGPLKIFGIFLFFYFFLRKDISEF